jgi:hypothetical protein
MPKRCEETHNHIEDFYILHTSYFALIAISEIPVHHDDDEDEAANESKSATSTTSASSVVETVRESTTFISSVVETVCESDILSGQNHPSPDCDVTIKIDATSTSCTRDMTMVDDRRENRPGMKRRWNEAELGAFNRVFKQHISNKNMATGKEIQYVQEKEIPTRSIAQIRTRLNNIILGKQKMFECS